MADGEKLEPATHVIPDLLSMNSVDFTKLVTRFFDAVVPDFRCVVCSHDSLTLSRSGARDSFHGLAGKRWGDRIDMVIYYFGMRCNRCGHMMLHDYSILAQWQADNPEDEA